MWRLVFVSVVFITIHLFVPTQLIPKVIARVLLSSIQFQLVQVEGFRLHLQQREVCMRDLERAEREKVKALEEKHRASVSGTTPPPRRTSVNLSVNIFAKKGDELVRHYSVHLTSNYVCIVGGTSSTKGGSGGGTANHCQSHQPGAHLL
jgi:hypothetical protein